MKSLIDKKRISCLILYGMALIMLLCCVGCCGMLRKLSEEEIAKRHLEKAYGKEFVVEDLTKKDAGPFLSRECSGFAYEKDNPENRFKVWVDTDHMQVTDAYDSVPLLAKASEWVQGKASGIWNGAKAGIVFDVLRPNTAGQYKEDEFLSFLENESVDCVVYLLLNEEDGLTSEKYEMFNQAISQILNGYVHIFVLRKDELSPAEVADYYNREPNMSFSIRETGWIIQSKLQQRKE